MGNMPAKPNKNIRKQQRIEKAKRRNKVQQLMLWTLGVVLLGVMVTVFVTSPSSMEAGATVAAAEFQYEKQPALGSKDAPVKIVEFGDFKCPACMQFEQTIYPQLKKDFIDTGVAQMHFINYPIISPNGDSRTAAIAGEAVYNQNPEAFWTFYEAVYAHQGDERTTWATPDALIAIAKQANLQLDYDKLKQDMENEQFAQEVSNDEAIVRKLGVGNTPTIYVNGQPIANEVAFNYSELKALIEATQDGAGK